MRGLSHPAADTAFGVLDDPAFLLRVIADRWRGNFDRYLPRSARNLVFTSRGKRNEWAHNRAVQLHDALYTLSGILTLVEAVDAAKAGPVRAMLDDLNRTASASCPATGFHIARLGNECTVSERPSAEVREEAALHTRFPAVILRRTWLDGTLRSRWKAGM